MSATFVDHVFVRQSNWRECLSRGIEPWCGHCGKPEPHPSHVKNVLPVLRWAQPTTHRELRLFDGDNTAQAFLNEIAREHETIPVDWSALLVAAVKADIALSHTTPAQTLGSNLGEVGEALNDLRRAFRGLLK